MSGETQPAGALVSMTADLPCALCGVQSAHVELVAPGDLPAGWAEWDARGRESYQELHDPGMWRWIYDGPAAGSGSGFDISEAEAARIAAAFAAPVTPERVRLAGLYDNAGVCLPCGKPYCRVHWHVTVSGFGTCPQGHGKSLDMHWSGSDW